MYTGGKHMKRCTTSLAIVILSCCNCCSVTKLCLTLQPHGLQHTRLLCPSPSPEFTQILTSTESVIPSNHLILCCPLLLLPSIFPSIRLFQWVSSLHQMAKVFERQLQHQSFQGIFRVDFLQVWLVWFPCYPRNSQESSPTSQFKVSILRHSALFIGQLTHIYDYWKNHSFDYMDFCQQSDVSAF